MIGIIDYGSGNIQAIATIYNRLNIECKIVNTTNQLADIDKIVLPGVGAFDAAMERLFKSGMKDKLDAEVLLKKKPVLGICVGMQILGNGSDEGKLPGLGWIPGYVHKFDPNTITKKPKFPHMGWNTIEDKKKHSLFSNIDTDFGFYFVHSYYFKCESDENILSTTNYGINFASTIENLNIIGTQFHPEKSHKNGIQLFKNFAIS
ncbi:MAG: imidazole glycerol phosphate synthase subunit HisH [Sphingobacteriales bacterium]|jgi:glutamine amidotransferase|nr:imidazole glycerol phosphate synthase subunit HisH [Sphingobacteriales bacterium]